MTLMSADLFSNNFLPIPLKTSFHMKKKVTSHSLKFASIETFLILEVSQYCKSGSTFFSSEQVTACSKLPATAAD